MSIPLEDEYMDVLQKAAVGLRLGPTELAARTGLGVSEVRNVFKGAYNREVAFALAESLGLKGHAVCEIAEARWRPESIQLSGLEALNLPFTGAGWPDATVNAYLMHLPGTTDAVLFDTGVDAGEILRVINARALHLRAVILTHTHRDHVGGLASILEAHPDCMAFAPSREPYGSAQLLEHGESFELCGLQIEARLTNGHSRGGMSYIVNGLERPVAIAGDAIFAGSIGGAKSDYATALQAIRTQLLSLPENTILCPGHGPMTTVSEELQHNPFFAG